MNALGQTDPEKNAKVTDQPVPGFDMAFEHNPAWDAAFDRLTERVRGDISRAKQAGQLVIYLSCPISSRGGGFSQTNVDIAQFIESRLRVRFGDRFWILNPALYQHHSDEGAELIKQLTGANAAPVEPPGGGDYMRMWTKALVEGSPEKEGGSPALLGNVDAFYFVGPRDVHDFFLASGDGSLSACIEGYLSRKLNASRTFRTYFDEEPDPNNERLSTGKTRSPESWTKVRDHFFGFYALKASAAFSKGSHDEWNIFHLLNAARLQTLGVGEQLPGYFDAAQIDPTSAETGIFRGYQAVAL